MTTIPPGWVRAKLPELVCPNGIFIDGDWVESKDQDPSGDVRLIQLADIGDGYYLSKSNRFLTSASALRLNCTFLERGDVLIARMPDPLGRACIFPGDIKRAVTVVDVAIFRSGRDGIDHQWLVYAINAKQTRAAIAALASGTTRSRISRGNLARIEFPVPPAAEQHRIAAKLDAIFAQTRATKTRLERLPALLEKLKRSMLAAAFRGDLTADWRAAHPDAEPASVLLDRIRAERRRRWEGDLRAKSKSPTKPTCDEFAPDEIDDLPELPRGWEWAGLTEVAEIQLGQRRAPEYAGEAEFPYVRAANITWRGLDLTDLKTMGFVGAERLFLKRGDVLLSEASGSATEVGKPGLWQDEVPNCCFQATVLRLRPNNAILNAEWLYYSCLADAMLGRFAAMAPGIGILHLTAERMRRWPVAVAPMAEQLRVVAVMREIMSRLYASEDRTAALRTRLERLEQAALAKAFRGKLVPQDPNDEPAAVLLERIRVTRTEPPERSRRGSESWQADAPTSGRKSNGHRITASSDDLLDLVVAALQQGKPRLTAADIADVTNLDTPAVKQVLKTLVAAGQVRIYGKARGTAYEWIG